MVLIHDCMLMGRCQNVDFHDSKRRVLIWNLTQNRIRYFKGILQHHPATDSDCPDESLSRQQGMEEIYEGLDQIEPVTNNPPSPPPKASTTKPRADNWLKLCTQKTKIGLTSLSRVEEEPRSDSFSSSAPLTLNSDFAAEAVEMVVTFNQSIDNENNNQTTTKEKKRSIPPRNPNLFKSKEKKSISSRTAKKKTNLVMEQINKEDHQDLFRFRFLRSKVKKVEEFKKTMESQVAESVDRPRCKRVQLKCRGGNKSNTDNRRRNRNDNEDKAIGKKNRLESILAERKRRNDLKRGFEKLQVDIQIQQHNQAAVCSNRSDNNDNDMFHSKVGYLKMSKFTILRATVGVVRDLEVKELAIQTEIEREKKRNLSLRHTKCLLMKHSY